LERLYKLFKNAPDLGSLINPGVLPDADRMFVADYEQVEPLFEKALANEKSDAYDQVSMTGDELVKATRLLKNKYVLVVTNVPYLGRNKQSTILVDYCDDFYRNSKADLATVFLERCKEFSLINCSYVLVIPQNWTFLVSYKFMREVLFRSQEWNVVARLGPQAFRTQMYDFNVALMLFSNRRSEHNEITGIDASGGRTISIKVNSLVHSDLIYVSQEDQIRNPDYRLTFTIDQKKDLLGKYAIAPQGIKTGDDAKFRRYFWEIQNFDNRWRYYQSTPKGFDFYDGMESIIDWNNEGKDLARKQGQSAWNKKGIVVGQMNNLPVSLYLGDVQDSNVNVIIPLKQENLPAIYYFLRSEEFKKNIRAIDQKISVTNSSMIKVGIDLNFWIEFANSAKSLPDPFSDNPTQWLFTGNKVTSSFQLQVIMAGLLGYQWPNQINLMNSNPDLDGIICLPAIRGKPAGAEQLRESLATHYSNDWSTVKLEELLSAVGHLEKNLGTWIMDNFFEQHCKLFHNRPFIWHIYDGRKDGFSALVNYHKLDHANLEKLTYTYLGSWIADRKSDMNRGIAGAEGRLLAAQALQDKLKFILEGEPPFDIYVRWKSLHEQPIGWNPDLNDGVRLNIRPFVTAGILRSKCNIKWDKDRGKNPDGSERLNDLHFTNAQKQEARRKAGLT
jgi:hypothetical protein